MKNTNGLIKEYDYNGNLIFKGEYLNGKRNGKVKEYYSNGKLLFEGEYLNGIKHSNGKEYYSNGELEFEGEFLNGEKNGKGKEYYFCNLHYNGNYASKLKFEGEYLNGKRWNGKGYNINGNIDFIINNGNKKGIEYHYDTIL